MRLLAATGHAGVQRALLRVAAGEWVAPLRGLSRTRVVVAESALDLLRLHAQAGVTPASVYAAAPAARH